MTELNEKLNMIRMKLEKDLEVKPCEFDECKDLISKMYEPI